MSAASELVSLFVAAFLFGTLLPGSSEAALAAVLKFGSAPAAPAILVAFTGNTLAGLVNWAMGRFGAGYAGHPRFPLSPERYERCRALFARYGVWALLFSWLPIIGDPLLVAAGVMRTPLRIVLPLMAIGKLARYLFIAGALSFT